MSLYIQGMSTCAVQEIVSLSVHSSPLEAMMAFCRATIGDRGDCAPNGGYTAYSYGSANKDNKGNYTDGLGENYIFHGVENLTPYGGNKGYASKFAAFLIENKLGNVHGGDPSRNHRYHPDHITRVFVFNPDREAVFAWWGDHKPKPIETPKPVIIEAAALIEDANIVADAVAKLRRPRYQKEIIK